MVPFFRKVKEEVLYVENELRARGNDPSTKVLILDYYMSGNIFIQKRINKLHYDILNNKF